MELPSRAINDLHLPPGEMLDIRRRLRNIAARHDLATVIAYAFDHRTRVLPFIFADLRLAPAGPRAIGSVLVDSGFPKTRIVLQQWNPNFKPSQMKLDGRVPDLFLVSSMHLHSGEADRLMRDACLIDPAQRPLIIAGGPRMIYAPWEAFSADPACPAGADVVVTGEEYVFLQLLEVVLSVRAPGQTLRAAFQRAKNLGMLDTIPGLVYGESSTYEGPTESLVDTGIQRLLGNLDELPSPVIGYELLEFPSKDATLGPTAIPANRVRKYSPFSTLVMTQGCKFRCSYCPIPAYNQRTHRTKSGERVAEEMGDIAKKYNIVNFFGTDDNFFNDKDRTLEIIEPLARQATSGKRPFCKIAFGTEATVHDTIKLQEYLPRMRQAGLRAVWLGVEDLTATLVKKGQSESKTIEAFHLLRQSGIMPVPMLMHHDTQPLYSWKGNYGLINQLRTLRKAGSMYMQVLMLTPAPGSKWFGETYSSGLAFAKVGEEKIEPYRIDGNYVVASKHKRPWTKQMNLLLGYTYFFNPLRLAISLVSSHSNIPFADAETRPAAEIARLSPLKKLRRRIQLKARAHFIDAGIQLVGMAGLFQTYRRTIGWAWRLGREKIEPSTAAPRSKLPMHSPNGGIAAHDLPAPGLPVIQAAEPEPVIYQLRAPEVVQLKKAQ